MTNDPTEPSEVSSFSSSSSRANKKRRHFMGRGKLIGGERPASTTSSEQAVRSEACQSVPASDLESACPNDSIAPPESDYAERLPPSLWQTSVSTETTEDIRNHARTLVEPDKHAKRRTTVWIGLAGLTLLLIGAVVAVAIIVFANGNDGPSLTARQKVLDQIVSAVSTPETLKDKTSPQYKARQWLLFEDTLWIQVEEEVPSERVVQRYALAVVFFATGGETSWRSGHEWLINDECDPWDGLNCNEYDQVRALAFSTYCAASLCYRLCESSHVSPDGMGLRGTLPPEIGRLSMLENLIIKNEELSGQIPPSLGHLINLEQLGLYNNELQGPIPVDLFRATNLRFLNLQGNNLEGPVVPHIEMLSSLETLVLMDNQLNGTFPFRSLLATPLEFLGLGNNQFDGEIPGVIGSMSELRYLYLDGNEFRGKIPSEIGDAWNLQSINLDKNELTGNIPASIGNLHQLEYLSMQYNQLQGSIPAEFDSLSSIKTLSLGANQLGGPLPVLSGLKSLEHLYLFENDFTGAIHSHLIGQPKLRT